MGSTTGISWTDSTWGPWQGCRKVSPGCDNCYMHRDKARYGQDPGRIHRSSNATFRSILSPKKYPPGATVFVCSWSDFFLEEADELWRHEAWDMMDRRKDLTFLLLTKRPENIESRLPEGPPWFPQWPWPHVWLGVTAEDQQRADERIPVLLNTPAAGRFVSVEPMLEAVDLSKHLTCSMCGGGGWIQVYHSPPEREPCPRDCHGEPPIGIVIAGGESGPQARPSHPDWFRSLRDQCAAARVGFHFKQHGEWRSDLEMKREHPGEVFATGDNWGTLDAEGDWFPLTTPWNGREFGDSESGECTMVRVGKKSAGRTLDGRQHDDMPGEVRG